MGEDGPVNFSYPGGETANWPDGQGWYSRYY